MRRQQPTIDEIVEIGVHTIGFVRILSESCEFGLVWPDLNTVYHSWMSSVSDNLFITPAVYTSDTIKMLAYEIEYI